MGRVDESLCWGKECEEKLWAIVRRPGVWHFFPSPNNGLLTFYKSHPYCFSIFHKLILQYELNAISDPLGS